MSGYLSRYVERLPTPAPLRFHGPHLFDLGLRPSPQGGWIHRVDCHEGYFAGELALGRAGYQPHDWHVDGEGLSVIRWTRCYSDAELRKAGGL